MKQFIIIFFTLILNVSIFANSIGVISAITGKAQVQRDGKTIDASIKLQLQEHDVIITKNIARLQIIFIDNTIITLGQNTNFIIQKYNFEENKISVAHFLLQKGTMRASTGKIGKLFPQNFVVNTKDMKIGVMGTDFTISISEDGIQKAYCTYGAISVATDSKNFTIPSGTYLTREIDGTRKIADIPKEHYQDILLKTVPDKTTKSKTTFNVKSDKKTQKATSTTGKIKVEVDGQEYELDEGSTISVDKDKKINIDITNTTSDTGSSAVADINAYIKDSSTTKLIVKNISLAGRSTKRIRGMINQSVILDILTDGVTTTMQDSTICLERPNWWFLYTLSATPTKFNSINDFRTTIVDIKSGSGKSLAVRNSDFYTEADLNQDDQMTWGSWNVVHASENGAVTGGNSGYWIAGIETDPNLIAGYTSTTNYLGIYKAMDYTKTNTFTGMANLNVNFANDNATLSIKALKGNNYSFDMTFDNQQTLAGPQQTGYGNASAIFYGPTGSSAGGNFLVDHGNRENNLLGVFQVTATTPPQ